MSAGECGALFSTSRLYFEVILPPALALQLYLSFHRPTGSAYWANGLAETVFLRGRCVCVCEGGSTSYYWLRKREREKKVEEALHIDSMQSESPALGVR